VEGRDQEGGLLLIVADEEHTCDPQPQPPHSHRPPAEWPCPVCKTIWRPWDIREVAVFQDGRTHHPTVTGFDWRWV
jgi:hypothetical protein